MSVEELVQNLKDGDTVAAGKAYNTVMSQKLQAVLDAKKIELAPTMAGQQPAVEVEPSDSESDITLGDVAQDEINN